MKKDMVTIICYGREEKLEREVAKAKYLEAMLWCDGSERERYTNIYLALESGMKVCTDGVE